LKTETSTNLKMIKDLDNLKESMKGNLLLGPLVNLSKTLDQAKAIMMFFESITEKNFRCTVSLTAARGRVNFLYQIGASQSSIN
jgi:tRNA(Met) C34 N-acetyltransferase TmcA